MKKTVKILSVVFVVIFALALLTACSTPLSGEYVLDASAFGTGAEKTYDFSINGKVTITNTVKLLGQTESYTYDGKYSIDKDDDGKQTITFTFENEDAKSFSGTFSFSQNKDDKTISIGGVTYKKK